MGVFLLLTFESFFLQLLSLKGNSVADILFVFCLSNTCIKAALLVFTYYSSAVLMNLCVFNMT
jgi:hypothetical protein